MSKIGSKLKKSTEVIRPVKNTFRTLIFSQMASASPPLGPIIGNHGLNIANFCKEFNSKTQNIKKGIPLPVMVQIKPDRSFVINIRSPPFSYYLKQAAGIEEARVEGDADDAVTGKITIKHCYEIAKIKQADTLSYLHLLELPEVFSIVNEKAQVLGIQVVKDYDPEEYGTFLKERKLKIEEIKKQVEEMKRARLLR